MPGAENVDYPECVYCGESVLPWEPQYPINGDFRIHRECSIRATAGSLAHQNHTCHCYGGTESDPPGMTRREAARAAMEYYDSVRG